ncbi:response regulator transcription factor [Leucobacter sp.]
MRVLIAEDERELADALAEGLRGEGYEVEVAYGGDTALGALGRFDADVLILDRDLPGVHGDTVCRMLREQGHPVRILMLTAASALDDRVAGLDLGADDYLPKPFAYLELLARLRAMGRRVDAVAEAPLESAGIRLDPGRRLATRDGRELRLTPREFAVLEELLRADGGFVTPEALLVRVWGGDLERTRGVVKITVHTLRKKLGEPEALHYAHGHGYRLGTGS